MKKVDWQFSSRTCTGTILFPDGSSVFLQGEDAARLDDEVEACETEEQIDALLTEYEHLAGE